MLICVKCKREMKCDKNGVGADFGHGHIYPCDRFICRECGYTILNSGNVNAYQDPNYTTQDEYLQIKQGGY